VCVPSRNEPFGIVILEAWAAGKPVVATTNGGPREFVTHEKDGFLVYDNPGSVAWGITRVFADFKHAEWMGEQGRVKAAYGFSWDVIAEHTEGVYSELM
jgi:glycosyltransferase involved in cell wall biosynthesis